MFEPKKYVKDNSSDPFFNQKNSFFIFRMWILPGIFIISGIILFVVQVLLPLYVFETEDEVSPQMRQSALGLASGYRDFEFKELENNFKEGQGVSVDANIPEFYYLSIPKLGIVRALVESMPDNLNPDKALGHYPGTEFPGSPGNSFIYGHSVLPMFYNPKNYKAIFSTLGSLKTGDEIIIEYNNKKYTYKVENETVKTPTAVDPLAEFKPKYLNEDTLTLMTCWPAGTKSKRLMIDAVLVE